MQQPSIPINTRLSAARPVFASDRGFTLIELVVVVALISITLFFTIPRFQDTAAIDSKKKFARWLIMNTRALKNNALQHRSRYAMHIDLDNGSLWTQRESANEEENPEKATKPYRLSGDMRLTDVEYPGREKVTSGQAVIFFYPQNYSDRAMIHLEDDSYNRMSFLIEPFLSTVKIFDEYVAFGS